VLAVIGFHYWPHYVPGGFVGVDIFFVVSGFLISSLLFSELCERDAFDAVAFYGRRVRRIFPALIVVLVACWVIGWLVLVQDEFEALEQHIAGASIFIPNFLLWNEAGYFDAASELKPLLHLWSLGIEEQFYLLWPPLVYLCWKRRFNLLTTAAVIVIASFALNVVLVEKFAAATFYLPHSRIWQLLAGAALAAIVRFHHRSVDAAVNRVVFRSPEDADEQWVANAKAWTGLALVLAGIFGLARGMSDPGYWKVSAPLRALAAGLGLDKRTMYPGWWALLPTVGTFLLVWAGPRAFLNRAVLARRGLVYIGLMSYPLYLWHWPLLAFIRITESGHPSTMLRMWALGVSVAAAWLTFVLVERPIRQRVSPRTPARVAAIAAILLIVGAGSFAALRLTVVHSRTPHFITAVDRGSVSPRYDAECNRLFPTKGEYCQQYAPSPAVTTALIGDSHAEAFLAGVGTHLTARGENVVHLGESGCPPLLDIERVVTFTSDRCEANRSILERVANDERISRVLMAFRGTVDVTGRGFGDAERDLRVTIRMAGTSLPAAESIRRSLVRTVEYLKAHGKTVWLLMQVPELDFPVDECAGRPFSFERPVRARCGISRAVVAERQAPYRAIIEQARREAPALRIFDPIPYLCDEQWCSAIRDGQLLYSDSNHLSPAGSRFLSEHFEF